MLQYVDRLLYEILPKNEILYNLCICAMDAAIIIFVECELLSFVRYAMKPSHRFTRLLVTHIVVMLTASPLYQYYVPYRVTHIQVALFCLVLITFVRQQVFVALVLSFILFLLSDAFAPVISAAGLTYVVWSLRG